MKYCPFMEKLFTSETLYLHSDYGISPTSMSNTSQETTGIYYYLQLAIKESATESANTKNLLPSQSSLRPLFDITAISTGGYFEFHEMKIFLKRQHTTGLFVPLGDIHAVQWLSIHSFKATKVSKLQSWIYVLWQEVAWGKMIILETESFHFSSGYSGPHCLELLVVNLSNCVTTNWRGNHTVNSKKMILSGWLLSHGH